MIELRSVGLQEAAAFLRIHPNALAVFFVAQFANNVRKR